MKFKTKDEFEAWLRDYSIKILGIEKIMPSYNKQKLFKYEILSKDYSISDADTFVMDEDIVYIINRVIDSQYYYICYAPTKESDTMWWTMISRLYQRDIEINLFHGGGWPSMMGAKIWILYDAANNSFINWLENPFEVKS